MALLRRVTGLALRRARLEQGKRLRDVAATARVSVQYLSEIERGRKEASSEVLAAVCAALGWQLLDLLDAIRRELIGVEVRVVDARIERAPSAVGSQIRLAA